MSYSYGNRVKDTTTTTGTGSVTLSGTPPTGFLSFGSQISNGVDIEYLIESSDKSEWEIGVGQLSGGTTLARNSVIKSSNSDSLVNFSAGTKTVIQTLSTSSLNEFKAKITSINADTTTAQVISGADDVSVATTGGTTTVRRSAFSGNEAFFFATNTAIEGASAVVGSANQVRVLRFFLSRRFTVAKLACRTGAASAGGLMSFGIYSADGNTKLVDSGTISTSSGGTVMGVTLGSAVTLSPGFYYFAQTCDNTTATVASVAIPANLAALFNGNSIAHQGTAANSASAAVLPSTLGTITAVSSQNLGHVKWQG